jgi:hypothetical protein
VASFRQEETSMSPASNPFVSRRSVPAVLSVVVFAVLFGGSLAGAASPPAPYSLPFQLRPAAPPDVVRLDTAIADWSSGPDGGTTVASLLLVSKRVHPRVALMARWGAVYNDLPGAGGDSDIGFTNVALGGAWGKKLSPDLRGAVYLLAALPVGSGGGNEPDAGQMGAVRSGVAARSAMDNAMFAVNDVVLFPGVDVAWVRDGWTVQGEATLLQLWRVRGEAVQADARRTNFTTGLHVGRFAGRNVSLAAELRYQRWLSTPNAVESNPKARDTATVAFGPRFHAKLGESTWFRPALVLALPLDGPLSDQEYTIVQVDLPVSF